MKRISKQNLVDFLNSKSPPNKVNEKNIEQVLYFSLIWNSFEGSIFDNVELNNQTLSILARHFASFIQERYINETFEKFKKRYVKNGKIHTRFTRLEFCYRNTQSNRDAENFVKQSLLDQNLTKEQKLKTVLLIIYRFRNNMFHGRKATLTLNLYEEIFAHINKFLIRLVTALIDKKETVRRTLSNNS